MKVKLLLVLLIAVCSISAHRTNPNEIDASDLTKSIDLEEERWVNSIFDAMSEEERLGQIFMIRAHSDKGPDHIAKVEKLIKDYHVGGLCFFQGTPEKQAELTNKYQALAQRVPLMISMDAEWGLGMRLKKSTISFPRQLMLGAIQDNRLLYDMGKELASQCRRLGVHINFAPVADVNNNSENPVINTRSFGEDRYNVAVKSYMYMKGMQDGNVMACAKHFPGHGDTNVDSHKDLPEIPHQMNRLDSIELFPFKILAEQGIQSMMIAHLHVPAIDNVVNRPTTLSKKAIHDLLQNKMGYNGLIFTDGLGMKGVSKHHRNGEVEAKALVAGNDVMLLPQDVGAAVKEINAYIKSGKLTKERIHKSVKKILRSKYRLGLTKPQRVDLQNLRSDLNNPQAKVLKRKLIENALTLVRNKEALIPIKKIDGVNIASLSIGSKTKTTFQKTMDRYGQFRHYHSSKEMSSGERRQLIINLKTKDIVFVGLHDMSSYAKKDFGLTSSLKSFIEELRRETKVVLVVFGNPYSLKYFDKVDWLLEAYNEDAMTQDIAAQALFGAFGIRGRLPVTASMNSQFNMGMTTGSLFRLGYDIPERVGLNSKILSKIDGIAQDAVDTKATPGCVVLVAKDGKVVFNKGYGYHTYGKKRPMQTSDIFDLASVTKIAASTISAMKLHEEGRINIYNPLSEYLPELKATNKKDIVIRDMMAHRAQLKAWIPFYEQTLGGSSRSPRPSSKYYSKKKSASFNIPVTDRLFMKESFIDEIWKQIRDSELRATRDYKYSDLAFYFVSDLIKRISKQSLDQYASKHFYKPLGLSTATFNAANHHSLSSIPPTEEDKYWRRQKVQGYVHDMGAAMLGGVSGHAGLFANANDVAIIMQMLLNKGYYGGQQFLRPETVQTFTTRHPECSRRGIGFDMLETNKNRTINLSEKASLSTFGHLGFTGIATWADPEHNIVYVFLSNRTYPSMKNFKLSKEDYRPRIQSVIYEALEY